MNKPREICTAHSTLSDLLAEHARHVAAVNEIQSKANPGGEIFPPHWIATAADLPAFFQYLEKTGRITAPPELFTADDLQGMIRREFLSGPPLQGGWIGSYLPSDVRRKLLNSSLFSSEQRARVPRLGRVKELLNVLSERRDYVRAQLGGKFIFCWPETYGRKRQ